MEYNLTNELAVRSTKNVYRDGDKTIKLFVPDYSKANILNEALNQARVEEGTSLNIPKLIEVRKIGDRWALVSEYIEGVTLESLMNNHPEKMDEYMDLFVNIQLEILENTVPLLSTLKDKFRRKLTEASNINDEIRYELLQRLEGQKNHRKLCHGDFNPSNIIIKENGEHYIIDWAHVTQGNASADAARSFLLFSMQGKASLAEQYLRTFAQKSGIDIRNIQRWVPIVAATQMTKGREEEQAFLSRWIDVIEFQ